MTLAYPRRERFFAYLRIAVTVAALCLIFTKLDRDSLLEAFTKAPWQSILLSIVSLFVAMFCSVLRWHWIVAKFGMKLSLAQSIRLYAISIFVNQLLPPPIGGDAYRVFATIRLGMRLSPAMESVIFDRAFAFATLILLVVALMPATVVGLHLGRAAIEIGVGSLLIATVVALFVPYLVRRFSQFVPRLLLRSFIRAKRLASDPKSVLMIVVLSLTTHLFYGLSLWWITPGSDLVNVVNMVFLAGCVVLITAIPISLGGWGVREGGVVAGLMLLGITQGPAIATALLWAFAHICLAMPGLALWSLQKRRVISQEVP